MRYFRVWILGGTSPGPFNIYNNSVDYDNLSTLYNSSGQAEGLLLNQLTNGNFINVEVPDNIKSIILYDVSHNTICSYYDINIHCNLDVEIINIEDLTPTPINTDCSLLIPEDFTPNGDNIYETFEILNMDCYPINEMFIYSGTTQGQLYSDLVFHSKSYHTNLWNGKVFNNGDDCPSGVYTWVLYINNLQYGSGNVNLIR